MFIAIYIWHMEASRFDCFLALYLGWKNKTVAFQDVFFNAICSILSEIWTHSGIREAGEKWLDEKVPFKVVSAEFQQNIRMCFSSIRAILEWVLPAISLSIVYLIGLCR